MTVEERAQAQSIPLEKPRSRAANLTLIRKVWPWVFLVLIFAFFTVAARTLMPELLPLPSRLIDHAAA